MRFRIGFAAPLSTPQAIVGVPMLRIVEMAVADARAKGLDVEVRAVDDMEDEAVAARVAAQLVDDPSVIAVIGHKNSGPSGAAGPVYAAAGLAQITQCSTHNALSRAGWRTFFRLCADNERQASVAAELAFSRLPSAQAVAVHDGTDYGRPLVQAFAARWQALSGHAAHVLAMHVGQEDFTEIVESVRAAGADLVDFGATEIESSKLMKALHAGGIKTLVISSEGGPDNPLPRLAGPAGEGSIHTYAGADPMATTASRLLVDRCRAEFGETPSYVVECYDAVSVIVAAIERGATMRNELRDAIAATDLEGVGGRIRFDPHGDRINAPVSLWQVVGGRMVPLAESPLPTA
ncbi:MAG TPA: branched-chain amino acid ABC transporter substrate-binding protein [Candidatus Dormibacteraeota bacterium]|nr:branched-chain amino acid ABC transporter substrate-binding protein [Candidatus Dormibacteraeota bacterium]